MAARPLGWLPRWKAGIEVLKKLVIPTAAGDPAGVADDWLWIDTTAGKLAFRIGGSTELVALTSELGGGGLTQEQVEDIIGLLIDDNADLDWTYDDGTPSLVAVLKAASVEYANIQDVPAARVLGRQSGAGTGPPTELTGAHIRTILGTLDADTLGGDSKATIIASAVATVLNSAPTALDTLDELAAALGDDPNFAATVNTALGARARYADLAIPSGAATAEVTHGFTLASPGAFSYRCYNTADGYSEVGFDVRPKTGDEATKLTITDESGDNIAANHRIFLTVGV